MKRTNSGNKTPSQSKKIKKHIVLSENKLKEITSIFLSDRRNANILIDLLDQFKQPAKLPTSCVLTVQNIFLEVLKRRDMSESSGTNGEAEKQYKEWLISCYEDAWLKLASCLQNGTSECKLQSLNSMFELLSAESKFPINTKKKKKRKNNFPTSRLQIILQSIAFTPNLEKGVMARLSEFTEYQDVFCNVWIALGSLLEDICKQQPDDEPIRNILVVLSKLPKKCGDIVLCNVKTVVPEDKAVKLAVEVVWKSLAPWQYSTDTRQLLLVILVERIMPQMENSIFLTDYLMDTLNKSESEISMLALQGIYNLVLKHNIEYPDIYGKLYQLFNKYSLNAKYKTRLYVLADDFLRSTHLPLALVAAFAKKFSRLLLEVTPPDILILMTFIANLCIRHPDLSFLYHKPSGQPVAEDPFIMEEKDPLKSRALESQLWEMKLLQTHHMDRVAKMAHFINNDMPSVEYQLEPLLDLTFEKMVEREVRNVKRMLPGMLENVRNEKPISSKMEEVFNTEYKTKLKQISEIFM